MSWDEPRDLSMNEKFGTHPRVIAADGRFLVVWTGTGPMGQTVC